METFGYFALFCIPPLIILIGTLGGFVGGKVLSKVLAELDSNISTDARDRMIKRSTFGFFTGAIFGSIPFTFGFIGMIISSDLSQRDVFFVAIGFALMGVIGATITSSVLFRKD